MSKQKRDAVIVCTARTPVGKIRGTLAAFPAPDLGSIVFTELVRKAKIDPGEIDEVIIGNLFNYDWGNLARIVLLRAGFPFDVPAITIDRQCSSSLNAVTFGAMYINAGDADVVLAGGVESYSQQALMIQRPQQAYPMILQPAWIKPSHDSVGNPSMITTAENLAVKYNITREECDAFALRSHQNATKAWQRGAFKDQVVPVSIPQKKGDPVMFEMDESVRSDTSMEALARLRPVEKPDGVVTAGNASPQNDAATGVIVMSREKAEEKGLEILATVKGFAAAGCDPNIMGIGPVPATQKLLKKMNLSMSDIDLFEVNEAFAAQSLAVQKALEIPTEKLNVDGGAIAIGHPNGASGTMLVARLLYAMKERDMRRGVVSFCCGGGQGLSVLFERD